LPKKFHEYLIVIVISTEVETQRVFC